MPCGTPERNLPVPCAEGEGEPSLSPRSPETDDQLRSYIAMALPLIHVLREQNTARAETIARQIAEKWGAQAAAVGNLLRHLEEYNTEVSDETDEVSNQSCSSGCDSSEDDTDTGSATNEEGEDALMNYEYGGSALRSLQEVVERVRSLELDGHGASEVLTTSPIATSVSGAVLSENGGEGGEGESEPETEEERRIMEDIGLAVKREMDRLSIIRKHR